MRSRRSCWRFHSSSWRPRCFSGGDRGARSKAQRKVHGKTEEVDMNIWMKGFATVLLAALPRLALADSGELHIYNWTDYTSDEMVKKFEKETGIKVTIDTYDSNETALAKLKSGAAGYDVMIISNDFVPIFVKEGLFQKVGAGQMPNFKNVDPRWQKRPWDPDAE